MESKFYCEKCNYRTDIASCYKQHLETTYIKQVKEKKDVIKHFISVISAVLRIIIRTII